MKRRAAQLTFFLLLGAIINVAVAWTCSMLDGVVTSRTIWTESGSGWQGTQWNRVGSKFVEYRRMYGVEPSDHAERPMPPAWLVPDWPGLRQPLAQFEHQDVRVIRFAEAHGLPVLCMWAEPPQIRGVTATGRDKTFSPDSGFIKLPLPPWSHLLGKSTRVLPLAVLPTGFAINTIFYAAILWLIFALPFALRRRRRIKRGLCAKCGYDLRGSGSPTCPECGKPAHQNRSRQQTAAVRTT